eukprot:2579143-Rhodomonas_salina.1
MEERKPEEKKVGRQEQREGREGQKDKTVTHRLQCTLRTTSRAPRSHPTASPSITILSTTPNEETSSSTTQRNTASTLSHF